MFGNNGDCWSSKSEELVELRLHIVLVSGFGMGGRLKKTEPMPRVKLTNTLETSPIKAPLNKAVITNKSLSKVCFIDFINRRITLAFAKGMNMPSEMTPSRGPPSKPKMLKEICNTVVPKY